MLAPDNSLWQFAASLLESRGSSGVEHALGKGGVGGSIPLRGTILPYFMKSNCFVIPLHLTLELNPEI